MSYTPTQFLFFRHGETDWNLRNIFQGHTDIRLNENGVAQAQALAEKIRFWKPDVVLSSDLTRALYTAEYSQRIWRVPIIQSADLREINLGQAEGLHRDKVMELVGPAGWSRWTSHDLRDNDFAFPNGESKTQARLRVRYFLEKYAKENPHHKRIVVSTHGGILRRVTDGLEGVPLDGVRIPNCVTYRLDFDGYDWSFISVRERTSAVVIAHEKILTFKAVDPHNGRDYHFLPGGKMEAGESVQDCVAREAVEETGYEVIPSGQILTREYDFMWNGKLNWCRTHFLKADLKTDFSKPQLVNDAPYNKGVAWISLKDLHSYFHYDESICDAVYRLSKV